MRLHKVHPLFTMMFLAFSILSISVLVGVQFAHANPLFFSPQSCTKTATSSISYMTPGTGTTTLIYDAYGINFSNLCPGQLGTSTQNISGAQNAELLVQFTASSSATSKLNINFEYADGPGNCATAPSSCDWYQDSSTNQYGYATTTEPVSLTPVTQYQWAFASSTIGQGAVAAANNRDTRALKENTPTRYERAVFTCALGGTNCAVWGEWLPVKQNP